jgi:hypothetical protein
MQQSKRGRIMARQPFFVESRFAADPQCSTDGEAREGPGRHVKLALRVLLTSIGVAVPAGYL